MRKRDVREALRRGRDVQPLPMAGRILLMLILLGLCAIMAYNFQMR